VNSLSLRPLTIDDASLTFAWRTSPHVDEMMTGDAPDTFERHQEWLSAILASKDHFYWVLVWGEREAGLLGLMGFSDDRTRCEFGIYIGVEDLVGCGIGRLAMERLLEIADGHLGIIELRCKVLATNARAIALYRSLGFEPVNSLDQVESSGTSPQVLHLSRKIAGAYR
jgi:UDP-4-amino-4,6-dideoxy-N-acetyl-beta-L-altrosamine N-acetyltransferase